MGSLCTDDATEPMWPNRSCSALRIQKSTEVDIHACIERRQKLLIPLLNSTFYCNPHFMIRCFNQLSLGLRMIKVCDCQ